ncbi:MAG TPA: hypothetical protein VHU40_03785 [Polyangia bacterium]|nr:hypothetical protein [Polyangia bacterium]
MTVVALALASGSAAQAAPRPPRRVLLIVDRPKDTFAERIRSEVADLGLTVVVLEPWRTREPVGPLEEAARAQHAVAAIHMLPSRKGVEVWMADETSGRSLLRQLIVDESPGGPNESLIALQTAELMRTSLLSQARPPATPGLSGATWSSPGMDDPAHSRSPAADVAARAEAPSAVAPKAAVQAAVGVLTSPGTGTPALQAWLSVERWLLPRLSVALDVTVPLHATTVSGPEGSARLGASAAGAAMLVHLEPSASPLFASAGLGIAALRVTAGGDAAAPLSARDVSAIVAAGYLRADGGVDVTSRFRLGLRAMVGATLQRVALRFAGNDAGSWGRPLVAGLLLAELHWP